MHHKTVRSKYFIYMKPIKSLLKYLHCVTVVINSKCIKKTIFKPHDFHLQNHSFMTSIHMLIFINVEKFTMVIFSFILSSVLLQKWKRSMLARYTVLSVKYLILVCLYVGRRDCSCVILYCVVPVENTIITQSLNLSIML